MVTARRTTGVLRTGSIVVTDRLADVVRIFEPDVNAVIHTRRLDDRLVAELAEPLAPRKLVVDAGPGLVDAVASMFAGYPALAADIALWADVVADLTEAPAIGVRLASTDHAMCPRFHVDHVILRVVVTYAGPGTELLSETVVDRAKLSPHHGGLPDECSGLIRDGATPQHATAGDVVFMKGELWPNNDVGGAVHRSPPQRGPRSILTLDPLG